MDPFDLHLHCFYLHIRQELIIIVLQLTAITLPLAAIFASTVSTLRNSQDLKGFILGACLDDIVLIVTNFIKLLVVRVNSVVDLLVGHIPVKEVNPRRRNALSGVVAV